MKERDRDAHALVDLAQLLGEPREIHVFLICVIVNYHMWIVFSALEL
jgi:hypothetical protein